jgi:hypothetical protein
VDIGQPDEINTDEQRANSKGPNREVSGAKKEEKSSRYERDDCQRVDAVSFSLLVW